MNRAAVPNRLARPWPWCGTLRKSGRNDCGESDVILFGGSFGGFFLGGLPCEINEKPTPKNEERVSETFYFFKLLEGLKADGEIGPYKIQRFNLYIQV